MWLNWWNEKKARKVREMERPSRSRRRGKDGLGGNQAMAKRKSSVGWRSFEVELRGEFIHHHPLILVHSSSIPSRFNFSHLLFPSSLLSPSSHSIPSFSAWIHLSLSLSWPRESTPTPTTRFLLSQRFSPLLGFLLPFSFFIRTCLPLTNKSLPVHRTRVHLSPPAAIRAVFPPNPPEYLAR